MANQIINIGNQTNDGTGDSIRDAFEKVNSNFADLYNIAGLGDGLQFIKLREFSPNPASPNTLQANTFLGISTSGQTIVQRTVQAGIGINIEQGDGVIQISNTASTLSSDTNPSLGGDLNTEQHRVYNLPNPPYSDTDAVSRLWIYQNFLNRDGQYISDASGTINPPSLESSTIRQNPLILNTATNSLHPVNKLYADSKISLAGVDSIDPETNEINTSMGYMSGPLILSRNPVTSDDVDYNGLVAATKNYVDNSSFVSSVNFFVSLDGRDNRTDIPSYKKGRAFAYAYKTITAAAEAAEQQVAVSQIVLGPYQKTITTDGGLQNVTIVATTSSPYVSGATRITVNWGGGDGTGTDPYINGSIFPGSYLVGASSGAIGLIEKIQAESDGQELYDVVPVDYALTMTSDLTPLNGGTTGTVVLQFVTPNIINIPDFWQGYIFTCDTGGQGTVSSTGYYTDPVTGNVYDQITVNFTQPLVNSNTIAGANWHVYSNFFQIGEELQWGQRQVKDQITIVVESGEHENNYPIKLSENCSIRGDEFRRSLVKPAKFVNSDLPTISVSPWVDTYFYRDTQVDGMLVAQQDTSVNYVTTSGNVLFATPNATSGSINIAVTATYDGNPVSITVDPSWIGYVFFGHGGGGVITDVVGNSFSVTLAENSDFQNSINSTSTLVAGAWQVYAPRNYGYHYLRDSSKPVNYVIPYQPGNYLTAKELLTLNRTYIQSEITAWINYQVSTATSGSIWYNFTYDQSKCYRDVGTLVDAICQDLDVGNVSNCITAADSYASVAQVQGYELAQTVAAIQQIGVLALRIVQNIPTGDTGTTIISYQSTEQQVYTGTYEPDMAVIIPTVGFSVANTATITNPGYGYDYPPTITFIGGNGTGAAATANVNGNGEIIAINIINTGSGYTSAPELLITPTGATPSTPAAATIALNEYGSIKSVQLLQGGQGYQTLPKLNVVGVGTGAVVDCTVAQVGAYWSVNNVGLVSGGYGYTTSTFVQVSGGTFYYDEATCTRDVGLIVDALAQDLIFGGTSQTTFAGIQYWNHDGYTGNISNEVSTTTAVINYLNSIAQKIIVNDTTGTRYQSGVAQTTGTSSASSSEQGTVNNLFGTITEILESGVIGVTDDIIPNSLTASTTATVVTAYNLLSDNISYLQAEAYAWITANAPGFSYNQTLCNRDVGYMVTSVCNDLLYGGNRQVIQSGVYYYGYNSDSTALPDEQTQSVSAYNYIKSIIPNIILGTAITQPYQTAVTQVTDLTPGDSNAVTTAQAGITNITNIITNGPGVAADGTPLPLVASGTTNAVYAAKILEANKSFLQAEIVAFIASQLDGGNISNSLTDMEHLISGIATIVGGDSDFNPPLYNDQLDVFLMNDANVIRYISAQGHGGFMKVLDPEGQIKAKSPYTQTASSFSKSLNRHVFSGGMLVDGFSGNLQAYPTATYATADVETGAYVQIPVNGLVRRPQCPTFFVANGITYEVDFISEFQADPNTVSNSTPTYTGILNLNPAKAGGLAQSTIHGSGYKASTNIPVSFSAPTSAGGVTAVGYVTSDGSGTLGVNTNNVTFTNHGTGYLSTAVSVIVGGAIISFGLNAAGSIDTTNISIINEGSGYAPGATINFESPTLVSGNSTATGFIGTVTSTGAINGEYFGPVTVSGTGYTAVAGIVFTSTGSGYTSSPTYTIGNSVSSSVTITPGYLGALPDELILITAGNRSMLANDFTQINDLGYGIFVTNGGFMENVSMFSYYCWTSYYALNGAQVRTITGSSAYGVYGLVSEGSDPNEVPISMTNQNDMSQILTFQNAGNYVNIVGAQSVYAVFNGYTPPYGSSEVEVNHYGTRKIYTIISYSPVTDAGLNNYYKLNLDQTAGTWYQTMESGETLPGTYRIKYIQNLVGLNQNVLTRTAVVFDYNENPDSVYRVSSIEQLNVAGDIATVTSLDPYDYIQIDPYVQGGVFRQGVYDVTFNNNNSYTSGTNVTVTLASPATQTAYASYGWSSPTVTTSSVQLVNSGLAIHVGMTVNSADGNISQSRVTWVDTSTNTTRVGLSQSYLNISTSSLITFSGTATVLTGVAGVDGVVSFTISESGVGYSSNNNGTNGPLSSSPTIVATLNGSSVSAGSLAVTQALVSGLTGGNVIKITPLSTADAGRITGGLTASTPYYYIFGYEGALYQITDYTSSTSLGELWDQITVERINQNGSAYATTGLINELMAGTLYAGISKGQTASLTQKISTLRATSHDMVDVGTGGYAASKIPNDLYGPPLNTPTLQAQVVQIGKGRVFYVTTDQDGAFSVGGLLVVEQATNTINFQVPINITTLPSLTLGQGGATVNYIDNDSSLGGGSGNPKALVTEDAIIGFVERRLGTSRSGGTPLTGGLIGPGYIDTAGHLGMQANLNMAGNGVTSYYITNLANPANGANNTQNAATRYYVDQRIHLAGTAAYYDDGTGNGPEAHPEWGAMTGPLLANAEPAASANGLTIPPKSYVDKVQQLSTLSDVTLTNPASQDILMFNPTTLSLNTLSNRPIWNPTRQIVNATNNSFTTSTNTPTSRGGGSDVDFVLNNNTVTIKLLGSVAGGANEGYNPITDYHVNSAADIKQYKLHMTMAATTATAPTGTQQQIQYWNGLSSYDPTMFTTNNGWVSLLTSTANNNGIAPNKLQQIPGNTGLAKGGILGSTVSSTASVLVLTSASVVTYLEALTKDGRQTLTGSLLPQVPAYSANSVNLGSLSNTFNTVYADTFSGTATKAISLLSSMAVQTYVTATTATHAGTIVQRDSSGNINGIVVIDNGGSVFPEADLSSNVGNNNKRFANVYAQNLSAGGNTTQGDLTGWWSLVSNSSITGGSEAPGSAGSYLGATYQAGSIVSSGNRFSGVYSRSFIGDGAVLSYSTITNTLYANSIQVTSALSAQSLSLTDALSASYGGTGATSLASAFENLISAAAGNASGTGQYLISYGAGNFGWASGGGGGSSGPSGSLITSNKLYYSVTSSNEFGSGNTVFTTPSYVPGSGQLRVYINGVRQSKEAGDFTEGSNNPTTTVTINPGCSVGDFVLVEVDGYEVYNFTAGNTTFSPTGNISATDVQDAIAFLDSDKMRKSGGTFTGNVTFSGSPATLTLQAGSTSAPGIVIPAGTILSTPQTGAIEFDGSYLYYTITSGPTRMTLATQTWVGNQGFVTASGAVETATTATYAASVPWSGLTGTAPNISTFSNNSGYLTSSGTISNATTAATANALNSSNNYQISSLGVGVAATGNAGEIYASSNIYAGGDITAFYTSDATLKTNIEPITDALGKVIAIRGVTFNWNERAVELRKKDPNEREAGVIAQEIQNVMPEAVATREDGTLAVRYEKLVPLLIEAIKELKAEVDALKAGK